MIRSVKYIAYIAIVIIISSSCKGKDEVKEEILRPVRYHVVGKSDAINERSLNGIATASEETELSFRNSGIITTLNAKVGQVVKKGELIAKLDNVQANLAFEQAVSSLNSAQSGMNTSKSSLERTRLLYDKGSASLSDYENAKNAFQNALDQFESAKRNKSIQQSQINYGFIYAPKDGVIAVTNSVINENVSAGQVIAILNSGEGMNAEIGLPENLINKVTLDMPAKVSFSALEKSDFEGRVIEIAPIVDANASTFPVKIDIINPGTAIKPGMIAKVTFTFGSGEIKGRKDLIVPVKTVGQDDKGNYVFIIESPNDSIGIAKKQHIQIGELTNEGFKIVSGLSEGQKIATAGLQTLLDGQKVKLQLSSL